MMQAFLIPPKIDDSAFGLEAMADVGLGGLFFGNAHTLERYENAFYAALLSDGRHFETWAEAGSPTTAEHANRIWKQLLAEYEEPLLDPGIRDELDEFVAHRKEQIGAAE